MSGTWSFSQCGGFVATEAGFVYVAAVLDRHRPEGLGSACKASLDVYLLDGALPQALNSDTSVTEMSSNLWPSPGCNIVSGTNAVTFAREQGRILTPTEKPLKEITYGGGVAVLQSPGGLVAVAHHDVLVSGDAGCTWQLITSLEEILAQVTPCGENFAWVWGRQTLLLVNSKTRAAGRLERSYDIVGLGTVGGSDAARFVTAAGKVFSISDAGGSWSQTGTIEMGNFSSVERACFAHDTLDDVFVATSEGIRYSTDGGVHWTPSAVEKDRKLVAQSIACSPVSKDTLWAQGNDVAAAATGTTSRFILVSKDGGRSFKPVLDDKRADFQNGAHLYPDPWNADVVYFAFGTNFGVAGTDLYRFDFSSDTLSKAHNHFHGIGGMTFHPSEKDLMYLTLTWESPSDVKGG